MTSNDFLADLAEGLNQDRQAMTRFNTLCDSLSVEKQKALRELRRAHATWMRNTDLGVPTIAGLCEATIAAWRSPSASISCR